MRCFRHALDASRLVFAVVPVVLALLVRCAPADVEADGYEFTDLFDPLASSESPAEGISGNNIVGYFSDAAGFSHGYIYDGSTFTTLDDPVASHGHVGDGTSATGISGSTIVGYYRVSVPATGSPYGYITHGFIYNGSTFTTLDDPLAGTNPTSAPGTFPMGVSGDRIVGYYQDAKLIHHGFVYRAGSYTTLDVPGANEAIGGGGTFATAVSGDNIVGYYDGTDGAIHGFIYNGSTFKVLDDPIGSTGSGRATVPYAVSGSTVAGTFGDPIGYHGFVYNGSAFTTVDDPLASPALTLDTIVTGISGSTLIGEYMSNTAKRDRGFIATPVTPVPPPSPNLLRNGDFSLGNVGFGSGYDYNRYLGPAGPDRGLYYIGTNPNLSDTAATSFGDHTTGSALMMLVSGLDHPNDQPKRPVWYEPVDVEPNTTYRFSIWTRSWGGANLDPSPADLELTINGSQVGTDFQLSNSVDQWVQFTADWNSQTSVAADIYLVDLNSSSVGNDFAIDDLSFAAIPEPGGLVLIGVGIAALTRSRARMLQQ